MRPTRTHAARLSLVGALAAVASLGAAAPPADVAGWQNIRWNMTERDVRRSVAALGLDVIAGAGPEAALQTTTRVSGIDCGVVFHFPDDARGLGQVSVRVVDTSRREALGAHAILLRTLTDTYGPATQQMVYGTVRSITRWQFETTTITLRFSTDTGKRGHPTRVSIVYLPALETVDPDGHHEQVGLFVLFKLLHEAWPP